MRILFPLLFIFGLISCKKESSLEISSEKDTAALHKNNTTDTASLATFPFETELCANKGYYDSSKYTKEQLEGTFEVYYKLSGITINSPGVFDVAALEDVRKNKEKILQKLDQDYEITRQKLNNLQVVDSKYWNDAKKTLLKEHDARFEFEKTKIEAFSDPSVLVNSRFSKDCNHYALALNTDETTMIAEWKKLRETMSKVNADPENIMREFSERLNSKDKRNYAMVDLITFGWGNCVNQNIPHLEHDENMTQEFNSLFVKIDRDCDEP